MATDLLAMMSSSVGQSLVSQAGRFLGASDSTIKSAVDGVLPALLGGVMQKASTPAGAADLMKLLDTPGLDPGIVGNLGAYLGGGEKTSGLLALGSGLLSSLFGDKLGGFINTIASLFGLKSTAASNLMALAAPMMLAFLKNHVTQNRLDAGGLATLLAGQSDFLKSRLDSRITSALGFGSVGAFLSSLTGAAGRAADAVGSAAGRAAGAAGAAAGRAADAAGAFGSAAVSAGGAAVAEGRSGLARYWPWLLAAAAAVILLPQLRYCGQEATQKVGDAAKATALATADAAKAGAAAVAKAVKTFELPNGVKIVVTDGGFMATMIAFLNSKDAALGKGLSFDEVYFDTASATLKAESTKQLEQLAAVLKAFPSATISVEGHTDSTGDAAVNKTLSAERAAAVEKALERMGIEDARISSAGFGPSKPIASNDTEDGRAQNRRVEVVVMKR
jgi:outer membrane protein OmpA-like peptidoglycan-associated protein